MAKSISNRKGLGKQRHIEVNQLWLQSKVANGEVAIIKVDGDKNLADALTKPVDGNKTAEHMRKTGGILKEGRHVLAPEVEEDGEDEANGWRRNDEDDGDQE